ncbi:hypothetical protein OEZ85_006851 [Tetradesmus obliquus]|uniref:Sulfatase N-terminal domain-containing protein n=1 Tax=Tetradesmus obliquus TaxID=3088 RepID=A0ABY8U0R1_TETOB|nr:hypothetical protein OEZ85_006851 [Tetradesmus obliquus]
MFKGKNVVMFLSDQERAPQDWPTGWAEKNLPGLTRLQRNGLTFKRAYTNACMCTSARAALFTGYFNPQHNARYVLEQDMPSSLYPQVNTPNNLRNLATAARDAGYSVVYKGKMHLSKPLNPDYTWGSADALQYGWTRWNYPDAGANQSLAESGGSPSFNDRRFMESEGPVEKGEEGALQWILQQAVRSQPFFLVISLVNPHDVLFYPAQFNASGYSPELLKGDIQLPPTVNESLITKPSAQREFRVMGAGGLSPSGPEQQTSYVNFYANLIKQTDAFLVNALDALDRVGLTRKTVVVKTADHGEMGTSHGGQIQKNFMMYEQATRIPLVFSNPELYPTPLETDALVSHADFTPTIASLLGTPKSARASWPGVDYSSVVMDPRRAKPPQDYVIFTFDDFQSGQAQSNTTNPVYVQAPCNVRAIIETRYKFAEYYDANAQKPSQWEMYDLATDPQERINLAWDGHTRTPQQQVQYDRLKSKLAWVTATRLAPLKGQTVAINLTCETARQTATQDQGNVTGQPVGGWPANIANSTVAPGATITLNYTGSGTNVAWRIFSGSGSLFGTASAPFGGSTISGVAQISGGTGAYRGLKAANLMFKATNAQGSSGKVTISGTAAYQ